MASVDEIKAFTDSIPVYDGNTKLINYFINRVDEIYQILNSADLPISKTLKSLVFINIKSKLRGKAAKILNEYSFENWNNLKDFLFVNSLRNKTQQV